MFDDKQNFRCLANINVQASVTMKLLVQADLTRNHSCISANVQSFGAHCHAVHEKLIHLAQISGFQQTRKHLQMKNCHEKLLKYDRVSCTEPDLIAIDFSENGTINLGTFQNVTYIVKILKLQRILQRVVINFKGKNYNFYAEMCFLDLFIYLFSCRFSAFFQYQKHLKVDSSFIPTKYSDLCIHCLYVYAHIWNNMYIIGILAPICTIALMQIHVNFFKKLTVFTTSHLSVMLTQLRHNFLRCLLEIQPWLSFLRHKKRLNFIYHLLSL